MTIWKSSTSGLLHTVPSKWETVTRVRTAPPSSLTDARRSMSCVFQHGMIFTRGSDSTFLNTSCSTSGSAPSSLMPLIPNPSTLAPVQDSAS